MAIGETQRPSKRFGEERTGENVDHDSDTDELDHGVTSEIMLLSIDLEVLRDDIGMHNMLPNEYFTANISGNFRDEELTADELGRRLSRVQIRNDQWSIGSQSHSRKRGSPNFDLIGCLNDINLDGDTLLNIFIINLEEKCAYWLINLVPSPECLNLTNNLFQSPLHLAVLTNQPRLVRRLIVGGATVDLRDHNGDTPLHIACRKGYVNIVEALLQPVMYTETLENDYDIPYQKIPQNLEILNSDGLTCLHVAFLERNIDVILTLLSKGSNINAKEARSGKTILHMAVESGNLLLLHFVLQKPDIDTEAKMYNGTTALDLARGLHKIPMTCLLREFGAHESDTTYDYESFSDFSDEEYVETNPRDEYAMLSKEMNKSSSCEWTCVWTENSSRQSKAMNTINTCDQNNQDIIRCPDFHFDQTRIDEEYNETIEINVQEATGIKTQIHSGKSEADFRISQDNNSDQNRFVCVKNRNITPNSSDNNNSYSVRNEIGKAELDIHLGNSVLVESPQQVVFCEKSNSCPFENSPLAPGQDVRVVKADGRSDNKLYERLQLSINISNYFRFSNNEVVEYERMKNPNRRQDNESHDQMSINTDGILVFNTNEGDPAVESIRDNESNVEIAYSGNVNGEIDSCDFNSMQCSYRSREGLSGG